MVFRHLVLGILLGTESRKESASVIFPPVGSKDILLSFFRLMKYNEEKLFSFRHFNICDEVY